MKALSLRHILSLQRAVVFLWAAQSLLPLPSLLAGNLNEAADGYTPVPHSEPPNLLIEAKETTLSENSSIPIKICSSIAPTLDLPIQFDKSDPTFEIPQGYVWRAGETNVQLYLHAKDNDLLDGDRLATLRVSVSNWIGAEMQFLIRDNERPTLRITLPTTVSEGDGILKNAGWISLGGRFTNRVVVRLSTGRPDKLTVTNEVMIPANASGVSFSPMVLDNSTFDGAMFVEVRAEAEGFGWSTNSIRIRDNDLHHLIVSSTESSSTTDAPIPLTVKAASIDHEVINTYAGPLLLSAASEDGELSLILPTNAIFKAGTWTGTIRITSPETGVRIRAALTNGVEGLGNAFSVYQFTRTEISLPVRDLAYDWTSQRLFASAGTNALNSSPGILELDPQKAIINRTVVSNLSAQKLIAAPGGEILYTIATNGAVFRVNAAEGVAKDIGSFGNDSRGFPFLAADIALAGADGSGVVISAGSHSMGRKLMLWRNEFFPSFEMTNVGRFILHSAADFSVIYGKSRAVPSEMNVIEIGPDRFLIRQTVEWGGAEMATFKVGKDIIYDQNGNIVDAHSLKVLHKMESRGFNLSSLIEVDPFTGRVFFLMRSYSGQWMLSAYDRLGLTRMSVVEIPEIKDGPLVMRRFASDGLAIGTSSGQVVLIRSELISGTRPALLASHFQMETRAARIGETNLLSLVVTNSGPEISLDTWVTGIITNGLELVGYQLSTGRLEKVNGGFHWFIGDLSTNEVSAILQVKSSVPWEQSILTDLQNRNTLPEPPFNRAFIPLQNRAWYEYESLSALSIPSTGLVYDGQRDRIYASSATQSKTFQNQIIVINPATVQIESSFDAGGTGLRSLAISSDGRYLYVAVDNGRRINQLDLSNGSVVRFIDLEPELIVKEMEVVPDDPEAIIVSRPRWGSISFSGAVAIYKSGQLLPQSGDGLNGLEIAIDGPGHRLFTLGSGPSAYSFQIAQTGLVSITNSVLLRWCKDVKYDSGLLFDTFGQIMSADSLQVVDSLRGTNGYPQITSGPDASVIFGIDASVMPDLAHGRLYFLANANERWSLLSFDFPTRTLVRSLAMPWVRSLRVTQPIIPGNLIKAGERRLAFRDYDHIFVVSDVTSTNSVDLALNLDAPALATVNSNLTLQISITNASNYPAHEVIVQSDLPENVRFVSAVTSSGQVEVHQQRFSVLIGTLPAASSAAIILTLMPTHGGEKMISLRAAAFERNSNASDNLRTVQVAVRIEPVKDLPQIMDLQVLDVAYNSSLSLLYLSIPQDSSFRANSITALNPDTGELGRSYFVGQIHTNSIRGGVGKLAIAENGSSLFFIAESGNAIQHINLVSGQVDPPVYLGTNAQNGPFLATDLKVVPGASNRVAVARDNTIYPQPIALLEDRELLSLEELTGSVLGFSPDGSEFFTASSLTRFPIVQYQTPYPNGSVMSGVPVVFFSPRAGVAMQNGQIFFPSGHVVDGRANRIIGKLAMEGLPAPDLEKGRIFVLSSTDSYSSATLHAFHFPTMIELGSFTLSNSNAEVSAFIRFGSNGFAFTSKRGKFGILRSSLVPTGPVGDLAFSLDFSSTNVFMNEPFTITATVRNAGNNSVSNAFLSLAFTDHFRVDGLSIRSDLLNTQQNILAIPIDALSAGASTNFAVQAYLDAPGFHPVNAAVWGNSHLETNMSNDWVRTFVLASPVFSYTNRLELVIRALEYEPSSRHLLVALQESESDWFGTLAMFDPTTHRFTRAMATTPSPFQLSRSSDGQRVYLSARSALETFGIPNLAFHHLARLTCDSILAPDSLAVFHERPHSDEIVGITWDNDLVRFRQSNLIQKSPFRINSSLEFLDSDIFVAGFNKYRLTETNIMTLSENWQLSASGVRNIILSSNLLYYSDGSVVDPANMMVISQFKDAPHYGLLELDGMNQLAFIAGYKEILKVHVYNLGNKECLATYDLPGQVEVITAIKRWGVDGLAVSTSANQLFLLRISEIQLKNNSDFDGDGLPDLWEQTNQLDPNDLRDARLDRDGDGASNLSEYLAATDPNEAGSNLRITFSLAPEPCLIFTSASGKVYVIETSDCLDRESWTPVQEMTGNGAPIRYVLPIMALPEKSGFYRVRVQE